MPLTDNINPEGGWQEWGRLVLNELERHNVLLREILEKQNQILRDYELVKREQTDQREDIERLHTKYSKLTERVDELERERDHRQGGEVVHNTNRTNLRWTASTIIMALGYVILPILFFLLGQHFTGKH